MTTTNNTKSTLAKIGEMLEGVVGPSRVVKMTGAEFAVYAQGQVTKALAEGDVSHVRLKALREQVTIFKNNYVDEESEGVNVTVFVDPTTAVGEKSDKTTTFDKVALDATQSVFEQGFVAKLQGVIASLKADADEDPDDMEKAKKAEADKKKADEEEETKRAEAKKVAKSDTAWPKDLNDKEFITKGVTETEPTWGRDR